MVRCLGEKATNMDVQKCFVDTVRHLVRGKHSGALQVIPAPFSTQEVARMEGKYMN